MKNSTPPLLLHKWGPSLTPNNGARAPVVEKFYPRRCAMIKGGIIGCGFVGGVLKAWLDENNKDAQIFVSDSSRGISAALL